MAWRRASCTGTCICRRPWPREALLKRYCSRLALAFDADIAGQNAASRALPHAWKSGLFVAQHGSWNRRPKSGYKVIYVPFKDGQPAGAPVDVLTGFLNADEKAQGRPVGVAIDKAGALLVTDDVGNAVWRVTGAAASN